MEIEQTKSIDQNFENLETLLINDAMRNQDRILNLLAVDYLKPFVEDFVNKIQTDWIYANLDEKMAVKSFALYLARLKGCLLYTSPSPRDRQKSRMPSSA